MPAPARPGTAGSAGGGQPPLRLGRTYQSPQARVWHAITGTAGLSRWSNQLIDYGASRLDFAEGASLLFVAKDSHLLPALPGRVTRADAPRLLEYTMGGQLLRWELAPGTGPSCRVVLTITTDFPGSLMASAPHWEAALDGLAAVLG